jgi:hypothetical protein
MRTVGTTCPGGALTDSVDVYADAGSSNGNTNLFRWTSEGTWQGWIYNLDTRALGLMTNFCYRLDVYIGGTSAIRASHTTYAIFKPVK